ncbi:MAG TPA: IS200/IS605 family transposase [Cyanobacteria bacterium UBA9579]|nr:IS200/IS605 family transposase [Cyanobacteria bacterium UBA9579]
MQYTLVFTDEIEDTLKLICVGISERYEINFVEIGADNDHVHFLIQSVPTIPVTNIVKTVKSITAKEIFAKHKEVRQFLWGGNIWTSGFYANTVGQYGNEKSLKEYVQNQGKNYKQIYRGQLKIFEDL